jgi:hypothetical protein
MREYRSKEHCTLQFPNERRGTVGQPPSTDSSLVSELPVSGNPDLSVGLPLRINSVEVRCVSDQADLSSADQRRQYLETVRSSQYEGGVQPEIFMLLMKQSE